MKKIKIIFIVTLIIQMTINIVGEFKDGKFLPGFSSKPSFKSNIRIISLEELEHILGSQTTSKGQTFFGYSNVYQNYRSAFQLVWRAQNE